jgi:hypothetical protein
MGGFLGSVWNNIKGAATDVGNTVGGIGNSIGQFILGPNGGMAPNLNPDGSPKVATPAPVTSAPGGTTQPTAPVKTNPATPPTTGAPTNSTPAGGGNLSGVLPSGSNLLTNGQGTITPASGNPGTNPNNIPGGGNNIPNPANPGNPNYSVQGGSALDALNNAMGGPQSAVPPVNNNDPNSRTAQINAITQNLASGANATPQETQLANEIANQESGLGDTLASNIMTSGDEGILTGRNAAANAQYGGRIQNMTALLAGLQGQRALSLQGGQAALGGAENNVPATQVLNPAQTLVSPFGGGTVGTGGGGGTSSLISSLAQQVASGQMSEAQAQSELPDQGLVGQLNQAILGINPGFSTTQSNTNAQVQGTLPPAAAAASSQLQNLQAALSAAPALEQTSAPVINSLATLASSLTGIGAGGTQGLQSALTDARAAMANALGAANNSTPSTYDSYVKTLLPDGITQAQLTSAIAQFQSQIQAKESAYGIPGAVSPTAGQGNSIYNF